MAEAKQPAPPRAATAPDLIIHEIPRSKDLTDWLKSTAAHDYLQKDPSDFIKALTTIIESCNPVFGHAFSVCIEYNDRTFAAIYAKYSKSQQDDQSQHFSSSALSYGFKQLFAQLAIFFEAQKSPHHTDFLRSKEALIPVTLALRAWSEKDSKLKGGSVLNKLNNFDDVMYSATVLLTDYIADLEVKNERLSGTILHKSDPCLYLYIINNLNKLLADTFSEDRLLAAVIKECRGLADDCTWKIGDEHNFPENLVRKTTDLIKAHEMLPKVSSAHALLAVPSGVSRSLGHSGRSVRNDDAPRPGHEIGMAPTRQLWPDKSRQTGAGHFFRGGLTRNGELPPKDDERMCRDCSLPPCLHCGGRDHSVGWCPRSEGMPGSHCAPGDKEQWSRVGRERQAAFLARRPSFSHRGRPSSETGKALIAAASAQLQTHRPTRAPIVHAQTGFGGMESVASQEKQDHADQGDMGFAMQARLSNSTTFPRVEQSNITGVTSFGIVDGGCNKNLVSEKYFDQIVDPGTTVSANVNFGTANRDPLVADRRGRVTSLLERNNGTYAVYIDNNVHSSSSCADSLLLISECGLLHSGFWIFKTGKHAWMTDGNAWIQYDDPLAIPLDNTSVPGMFVLKMHQRIPTHNAPAPAPAPARAYGAAKLVQTINSTSASDYSETTGDERGIRESVLRWQARLAFPHPAQLAEIIEHSTGHGLTPSQCLKHASRTAIRVLALHRRRPAKSQSQNKTIRDYKPFEAYSMDIQNIRNRLAVSSTLSTLWSTTRKPLPRTTPRTLLHQRSSVCLRLSDAMSRYITTPKSNTYGLTTKRACSRTKSLSISNQSMCFSKPHRLTKSTKTPRSNACTAPCVALSLSYFILGDYHFRCGLVHTPWRSA